MIRQCVLPQKAVVCEVGPRDGLQNEKVLLSVSQKAELIDRIADSGVRMIEIGSFVHPKAVPAMADTDLVAQKISKKSGVDYRALVLNKRGMQRALDAGVARVKLTVSASPTHSKQNSNATPEQVVRSFEECAEFARQNRMILSGAIATAFGYYAEGRIPLEWVKPLVEAYLEFGVREISVSDSTGFADPRQVYDSLAELRACYPNVCWTLHTHNTRGMAMANIFAALQAGVQHFDASFAGIGGCPFAPGASGNIATEDVVNMLEQMGVETGLDLEKTLAIATTVREWLGHPVESAMLRLRESAPKTSPAFC